MICTVYGRDVCTHGDKIRQDKVVTLKVLLGMIEGLDVEFLEAKMGDVRSEICEMAMF